MGKGIYEVAMTKLVQGEYLGKYPRAAFLFGHGCFVSEHVRLAILISCVALSRLRGSLHRIHLPFSSREIQSPKTLAITLAIY